MDKKKLLQALRDKLAQDLATAIQAARQALDDATHEESKPENQYDTRGLEASYLAGAQAERAAQLEEQILAYKYIQLKDFTAVDPIDATALVEVEFNHRKSYIFIMAHGGGLILNYFGSLVQVVTPHSPLGEALVGLKVGDLATVEVGKAVREYEILAVH